MLDESSCAEVTLPWRTSTPTVQQRIHEMRQPPGEILSLQTCIEVAMVDPEELASTADKIAKTISNLDPHLSECQFPIVSGRSGRSSRRIAVSTHLRESSHR